MRRGRTKARALQGALSMKSRGVATAAIAVVAAALVVLAVTVVARAAIIAETYLAEAKAGMVAVVPTAALEKPAVRPLRG